MRWFRRRKPVPLRYASLPPLDPLWVFRRVASQPAWNYVSMSGPYHIMRCDDDDAALVRHAQIYSRIEDAIADFARLDHPRCGEVCLLVDGDCQAILSWWDRHIGDADLRFGWVGCKSAFDLLAQHDPINSALWERLAYQEVTA